MFSARLTERFEFLKPLAEFRRLKKDDPVPLPILLPYLDLRLEAPVY